MSISFSVESRRPLVQPAVVCVPSYNTAGQKVPTPPIVVLTVSELNM